MSFKVISGVTSHESTKKQKILSLQQDNVEFNLYMNAEETYEILSPRGLKCRFRLFSDEYLEISFERKSGYNKLGRFKHINNSCFDGIYITF